MNYFLTEEQEMIRDLAAKISKEKIEPVALEYDEKQIFPTEIVKIMGQSDLFSVFIPEQHGGLNGGVFETCLVIEALSQACGGIALVFAASAAGTIPIKLFGNPDQQQRYLPRLAKGEIVAAYALTESEPDADLCKIKAELKGDYYVLNGKKQWVINAEDAAVYTVIAQTDADRGADGLSAFLVEKGTPGLEFGKKADKMGFRAIRTSELIFTDCKVSKANLLGKEGQGLLIALNVIDHARLGVAAQAVGIAAGAMEKALAYSQERYQRGQTISLFQGIQFMLADMATGVEAARSLTYQAARTLDAGAKEVTQFVSMAKLFASDTAMKVTTDAVQIYAGYGYTKEYPVEKKMRDAKVTQLYEGSNQIQREVIALKLLKLSAH